MAVIGFNFNKINVEKKDIGKGKVNISNNVAIKNIEQKGISYVLFIGSIYEIPIRNSNVILWDWNAYPLTDLYYSDVYDSEGNYSNWDTNNNNLFGETDKDIFDLYPDVHIGRLACDKIDQVKIVINKIINYERKTQKERWYYIYRRTKFKYIEG